MSRIAAPPGKSNFHRHAARRLLARFRSLRPGFEVRYLGPCERTGKQTRVVAAAADKSGRSDSREPSPRGESRRAAGEYAVSPDRRGGRNDIQAVAIRRSPLLARMLERPPAVLKRRHSPFAHGSVGAAQGSTEVHAPGSRKDRRLDPCKEPVQRPCPAGARRVRRRGNVSAMKHFCIALLSCSLAFGRRRIAPQTSPLEDYIREAGSESSAGRPGDIRIALVARCKIRRSRRGPSGAACK